MAKILIVHGISNQYVGPMELRKNWYPALCDGLLLAEYSPLPLIDDCFCPFYGDLFRPVDHLGGHQVPDPEDLENADQDEEELLEAIWGAAAETDGDVPSPQEFEDTLVWAPRIAERALTALARSRYLANYFPLQFFGDLKQVVLYLKNREIHEKVRSKVMMHIESDTRIVIGHSLGSIVAYEAICAKPEQVTALITVGSPLGIRNVVFDKLSPPPLTKQLGCWPGRVKYWSNIAAKGDIVAAQKKLAPLFGNGLEDSLIDSGWDAHNTERYLNSIEAGRAVARALALSSSHPQEG
jgi:hypothetical protein